MRLQVWLLCCSFVDVEGVTSSTTDGELSGRFLRSGYSMVMLEILNSWQPEKMGSRQKKKNLKEGEGFPHRRWRGVTTADARVIGRRVLGAWEP